MAARKKRTSPVMLDDKDYDPSDVTSRIYPEGVPTNPDGSVAVEGTSMTVQEVRTAGALNPDAAQYNKLQANKINRKNSGETNVQWGETRAMYLFDLVKTAFSATSIVIYIRETEAGIDYTPVRMSSFKTAEDFFRHMESIHRGKPSLKYDITFKDSGQHYNRGIGTMIMPDMTAQVQPQQQQPWNLPPAPPQYGGGYNPQLGLQPQYQQQPPQPTQPAAGQPQQLQAQMDPAVAALISQLLQDSRVTQQSVATLHMQLSSALGGLEEFKRFQAQAQFQAAPTVPAPPATASPPPFPYRTDLSGIPQPQPLPHQPAPQTLQFLGYGADGQPVYGTPRQAPVQAQVPPPPPPPPPAPQPKPQTPAEQFAGLAGMLASTVKSMEDVRKAVNHGIIPNNPVIPEIPEMEEPEPPAVGVIPLGTSEDAPIYAHNPDGSPNVTGMILANLPKLPAFLNKLSASVANVNKSIAEAERQRPIMVPSLPAAPQHSLIPDIPMRHQ